MEPPLDTTGIVLRLLAVVALVTLNGFFVASEFALVAVRRSRVEQIEAEGHPLAGTLRAALNRLNAYLAVCQLGITVASLALGWIGEPALASVLEPPLHAILPADVAGIGAHSIAVVLAFTAITMLHIVFGEQAPKILAIQKAEGTALLIARPNAILLFIFYPFIWVLNGLSNAVLRWLGLNPHQGEELVHSVDELRLLVAQSREAGVLEESEEDIVERALVFGEKRAHEIMVPRPDVVGVEARSTLRQALDVAVSHDHTRLPVYQETIDNVIGVVHLRDILQALHSGQPEDAPVTVAMRDALYIPEAMLVDRALITMRRGGRHFAVVLEEHGGTAGIVTLEDILEEVVGDIGEEFQPITEQIRKQADGSYLIDGLTPIDLANEELGIEIEDPEHDTIGGFVTGQLGRLGSVGDTIQAHGYTWRIEQMVRRRIGTLRVTRTNEGLRTED